MWIHGTKFPIEFWALLPSQRKVKISSDEVHAIFAHELQSTLRLMVGFFCKFIISCNKFVV
jgi:hypothetical protein